MSHRPPVGQRLAESGLVFDIKKFSIHDGPGIRTTVFFKGCPLNCWWCHNPESQAPGAERMWYDNRCLRCGACLAACEQGAISRQGALIVTDGSRCTLCGACVAACYADARQIVGRQMTVAEVLAEIERDVAFYDESGGGVTFSGGEPLQQPSFLRALLRACRARDIHTTLDTCGFATWQTVDGLRADVDLFLYDLKVMDDAQHRRVTGVSNDRILKNLEALSQRGHSIILRLPLIPDINDDEENVRRIGGFAARLPHLIRVDILPYHATAQAKYERTNRLYDLREIRPPTAEKLREIVQILQESGLTVQIGG